jgi:hypothetical protein
VATFFKVTMVTLIIAGSTIPAVPLCRLDLLQLLREQDGAATP